MSLLARRGAKRRTLAAEPTWARFASPSIVRQGTLAAGEHWDIRPTGDGEWSVESVWVSGQASLLRAWSSPSDATVSEVPIASSTSAGAWWPRLDERSTSYSWLRLRNTGSSTIVAGYSAFSLTDWEV